MNLTWPVYNSFSATNQSPIVLSGSDCVIQPQVKLASLTSFRVGGAAEWYIAPQNTEQLQTAVEWYQGKNMPLTLLGAGSNMLVSDRGISGLTISTRHLRDTSFEEETGRITAYAGEPIPRLAWKAAQRGWKGLEWAVGIPGTVGGAVVMNAGAHKSCIAELLVSALVLSPDGKVEELTARELGYSYRTSNLQKDKKIVIQATFQLQPGFSKEEVKAATTAHLNHRKETQPYDRPNCGSVFRNPKPHAAGWLIEQIGLKGYRIGDAQVAHRHANFILNCGNAKASDILQLIHHIQEKVESHWSLSLEPEVKLVGEF